jgi:hypothetical protein
MWIRSQDLRILTETHDLEVDSANQIWGSGSLLGEYSSKEKALKVLDDIQEFNECTYSEMFQMPQDEDVEV